MFDGNKYEQELVATTDTESNKFAYFFDQLPAHKQAALMKKLGGFAENPDDLDAFVQGTYAQEGAKANDGSPAKALGSSSSGKKPEDEALEVIMSSSNVPTGVKMLIKRAIVPSDPDYIRAEDDGTPVELKNSRNEVVRLTNELENEREESHKGSLAQKLKAANAAKKQAEEELENERDPKKTGSLAHRLDVEKSKAKTNMAPDMVEKAKVKIELDKLAPELDKLKNPSGSLRGKAVDHKQNAQKAFNAVVDLVK